MIFKELFDEEDEKWKWLKYFIGRILKVKNFYQNPPFPPPLSYCRRKSKITIWRNSAGGEAESTIHSDFDFLPGPGPHNYLCFAILNYDDVCVFHETLPIIIIIVNGGNMLWQNPTMFVTMSSTQKVQICFVWMFYCLLPTTWIIWNQTGEIFHSQQS